MVSKLLATTLTGTIAVALTAAALGSPAEAAPLPSNCPKNEHITISRVLRLCLYYDGNGQGAIYKDTQDYTPDFAGARFASSGDGGGQYVKNNAASAGNASVYTEFIFYNEHCTGPYDSIGPYSMANLVQTWNDEASYENGGLGDGHLGGC